MSPEAALGSSLITQYDSYYSFNLSPYPLCVYQVAGPSSNRHICNRRMFCDGDAILATDYFTACPVSGGRLKNWMQRYMYMSAKDHSAMGTSETFLGNNHVRMAVL